MSMRVVMPVVVFGVRFAVVVMIIMTHDERTLKDAVVGSSPVGHPRRDALRMFLASNTREQA